MSALGFKGYRLATRLLSPVINRVLNARLRQGKEDANRITERRGIASLNRPEGRLCWIHAASVGESQIALGVARNILDACDDLNILITSATLTSAELIDKSSSERVYHQFAPIDHPDWVDRFIDHWKPDLGVFVESEIWPNLVKAAHQAGTKLVLINARMNESSIKNWARFTQTSRYIWTMFDWIGAADQRTATGLKDITGRDVSTIGNLKLAINPQPPDPIAIKALNTQIGTRPVFTAASTHEGEEALLCQAMAQIMAAQPDALMILAPRHPGRAKSIIQTLQHHGLNFKQRSKHQAIESECAVLLADTLGEMALWYHLSPISIICGSLIDGIGGHNPIEATKFDSQIITGPFTASFDDVFKAYDDHEARVVVDTPKTLAEAVLTAWQDDHSSKIDRAHKALNDLSGEAMDITLRALQVRLDKDVPG